MAKKGKHKKGAAKKSPKKTAKAAKKSAKKSVAKKPAKKAPPKKAPPKKAPAKKPAPKKQSPAIKPPPMGEQPDAVEPSIQETVDASWEVAPSVTELAGKAMIINILGDAEAYFFDFSKLAPERRAELIVHHLAAFDQRKRGEGKDDWANQFVPIALLGESMPPAIRGQFDLSAPHEGVLLHHQGTGALLYAASKDDDKLAIFAPDLGTISPRDSLVSDVFDPDAQSYAYSVDRSQSEGFTLAEIETLMQTAGAELTLV